MLYFLEEINLPLEEGNDPLISGIEKTGQFHIQNEFKTFLMQCKES